ncbi:MAG: PVC-type heme-binding CxxCH protein [Verrucomicrobiota bacterium]
MKRHLVLFSVVAGMLCLGLPTAFAQADGKGKRAAKGKAPIFKSGIVKQGAVNIDVDITGAQQLWLVVSQGEHGYNCDWADWAEPRLIGPSGTVKLTDLKWRQATQGWGDTRVNLNAAGKPMRIAGQPVAFGIGTHAPSVIAYDLVGQNFTRFQARAGLDNGGTDQNGGAEVEFLVFTERPPGEYLQAARDQAAVSASERGSGPEAARESLQSLTTAPGLAVSLFASEPMMINPTDMDIDHRGRVWITEGANYRISPRMNKPWGEQRPGGDRIVILEDANGDGAADAGKVFYQDPTVNAALGICVLGRKVIVSSSPYVFILTDTDGDDKADKRELLFLDNSPGDHDHAMHAFVFGPDGKLYFNFGNGCAQLRRPKGGTKELPLNGPVTGIEWEIVTDLAGNQVNANGKPYREGLVFRCNLDGSDVETLGWNFRNNYEVAVDSFGTLWQSDNDDDGNKGVRINYVMEFGNYGYKDEMTGAAWKTPRTNLEKEIPYQHWHQNDPGVVPNLLFTGAGSPTGILVYEGRLLPKRFQNQMIHCDAGPRTVRAYPVQPDGAGYQAEMVDILTSSDSWYRPADVCAAPDGSIYIADWNDAGVGGHNMADRDLSKMRGRVYRVAPEGHKAATPKFDFTSAGGCAAALQSPNLAARYLAWTKLHELQGQAERELLKLWNGSDARMRARALHLLARIKGSEQKYLGQALRDKDADIRITGLRIARERKLDVIPYVKQLAQDPSPQVRRECALALRHHTSPEAPALWAQLARQHDGKDRWYLEALGIGADRQEAKYLAAWLEAVGNDWNTPAGRDILWRSRGVNALPYLVKIVTDKNTPEAERPRYLRALDFFPKSPEKDAALVEITLGALK